VPGVLETAALERERAEALLEPWLGKGNIGPDMPIPFSSRRTSTPSGRRERGADCARSGRGVTPRSTTTPLADRARRAGAARRRLGAFLLMAACAAAVVPFATRAGWRPAQDRVRAARCPGRGRVRRRAVQRRFARMAIVAGLYGGAGGGAVGALLRWLGGGEGLTPGCRWPGRTCCVTPVPLLAALTAAVAARRTTLRIVQAEP
jgi:cell division transport system permease protein